MAEQTKQNAKIVKARTGIRAKISKVWIIPALALLLSFGIAIQHFIDRDVMIRIDFPDASGIEVGKTELKFRKVKVGVVEDVEFSDDLGHVKVFVSMNKDMVRYVDADALFWLVKPVISINKISGLETLLSGAYINASWDAISGEKKEFYLAEEKSPLIEPDEEGIEIKLLAEKRGSISVGAPILYKGVNVGKVKAIELGPRGSAVSILAFIEAPYVGYINTGTRFWNASGIEANLGASGVKVNFDSIAALLQGGIAFSTSISGGSKVTDATVFDLYRRQEEAEDSRLDDDLRATVHVTSPFEGSVKGLKVGAGVEYRGLRVGHVKGISADTVTSSEGVGELRLYVSYTIQPSRLGITKFENPDETLQFLSQLVQSNGLRARLATNSILSGGLHVELIEIPDAETATIDLTSSFYPILPSIKTSPETLKVAVESVLDRVASLPVEELMDKVINLVSNIDTIVADTSTREIPSEVATLIDNLNDIAGSEDIKAIPKDLRSSVGAINNIVKKLEESQSVDDIILALENVKNISTNANIVGEKLPKLVNDLDALLLKAHALPLETLLSSAEHFITSADGFISNDNMEKVPAALSGALEQVKLTLKELREGGTTENLNQTLGSANNAMAAIAQAAKDLPSLVNRLESLSTTAKVTIAAYGPTSPVYREVRSAINDVDKTVRSLNSLIKMIERRPNALITGR